jgi:hypothetical protein
MSSLASVHPMSCVKQQVVISIVLWSFLFLRHVRFSLVTIRLVTKYSILHVT